MAFFGASGLLVYGAAWLLIPEEGSDRSLLERHLGRRPDGAPDKAVVIGGIVLLFLVVATVPWWSWGSSWHPAALLLASGVGLYLLLRRGGAGSDAHSPGSVRPPTGFESWLGEQQGAGAAGRVGHGPVPDGPGHGPVGHGPAGPEAAGPHATGHGPAAGPVGQGPGAPGPAPVDVPGQTDVPGQVDVPQATAAGETLPLRRPDDHAAAGQTLPLHRPEPSASGPTVPLHRPDDAADTGETRPLSRPDDSASTGETLPLQPPGEAASTGETLSLQPPEDSGATDHTRPLRHPDHPTAGDRTVPLRHPGHPTVTARTVPLRRPDDPADSGDASAGETRPLRHPEATGDAVGTGEGDRPGEAAGTTDQAADQNLTRPLPSSPVPHAPATTPLPVRGTAGPDGGGAPGAAPDTAPGTVSEGRAASAATRPMPAPRPGVTQVGSWRNARPQPPEFWNHPDPLGLEDPGFTPPPHPGPVPVPPRPAPPPPRSKLFWVTSACALIALGILAAFDNTYDIQPAAYLATALGVVGLGLVVGAWVGRSPGLVVTGVLLALVLAPVTIGERLLGEGAGPRTEQVTSVSEIQRDYRHGAGEFVLDLSRVRFTDADSVSTAVRSGAGEIQVIVPPDVDVAVQTDVGFGDTTLFGTPSELPGGRLRADDEGEDGPGGGKLRLRIELGAGDVEVHRG